MKAYLINNVLTCTWFVCVLLAFPSPIAAESSFRVGDGTYAVTAKRWKSAFRFSQHDGTTYINRIYSNGGHDRLHKNGGRDTIIFVPHTVRPENEITVLIWFHGLGGFTKKEFSRRLIPQFNNLLNDGANLIVVIPEMPWSTNTSSTHSRQGRVWRGTKNDDFVKFYGDVSETIEKHFSNEDDIFPRYFRTVIVGHSAGGSAISSAAKAGAFSKISELQLIVFSDASYGRWFDVTWKYFLKNNEHVDVHVLVRKYDRPYKNIRRFQRYHQNLPERLKIDVLSRKKYTHTRIGNRVLLLAPVFNPLDNEPGC